MTEAEICGRFFVSINACETSWVVTACVVRYVSGAKLLVLLAIEGCLLAGTVKS